MIEENVFVNTNQHLTHKYKDDLYGHKIEELSKYLNHGKIILFYPGSGRDIIRPIFTFYELADEFYFIDNNYGDLNRCPYRRDILKDSFITDFLKKYRIGFLEKGRQWFDIEYTWYRLMYNNKEISFKYFHDSWENVI